MNPVSAVIVGKSWRSRSTPAPSPGRLITVGPARLLLDHDDKAMAMDTSVVASATRSPRALGSVYTKQTDAVVPVHRSFRTLLEGLATIAGNRVQPEQVRAEATFETRPSRSASRRSLQL